MNKQIRPMQEILPKKRSKLYLQIMQTIQQDTSTIDKLLSDINKIKDTTKLIQQCKQYMLTEQDQTLSKNLIWKYDQKYNYQFDPFDQLPYYINSIKQIVSISIETRNNWIQEYLDRQGVIIYGKVNGNTVQVISECDKIIKYHISNGNREPITSQKQMSNKKIINQTIYDINLKDFYCQNRNINIQFHQNKCMYSFGNSLVKLTLYESDIDKQNLILLDAKNRKSRQCTNIRRVLIFKLQQIHQEQFEQELLLLSREQKKKYQYRVYQGYFEDHDFIQPLFLPPGQYIFMPFPDTNITIYTKRQEQFDFVPETQRQSMRQLNLMLQGFPECHPQNMKADFMRQCDLNKGIVIQIYRNIYENQICFKNIDIYDKLQDKLLLFQTLYSKRYQNYRLKKGEIIVQFYEITKKPAYLYQPQKKVLVDKCEDHQAKTIHLILR